MNDEPWVFLPKKDPFADPPPKTAWDVVRLWEVRRLRYNVIIGALVGIGWLAMTMLSVIFLGGPDLASDLQSGLYAGAACLVLLVIMNLFFTVGWVSELLIRALFRHNIDRYGPVAFKVILAVSIPAVPVLLIWFVMGCISAMCN